MNHIHEFRDAIAATGLVPPDDNTVRRFLTKISIEGDCWIWQAGRFKNGYGKFAMVATRAGKEITYAHRCSYRLFVGPIAPGLNICHRCDNPACVNPDHLFAASQLVNIRDCISKGRARYHSGQNLKISGERHVNSKLTDADVRSILCSAESNNSLAVLYGVSPKTIWKIRARKAWEHIEVSQ